MTATSKQQEQATSRNGLLFVFLSVVFISIVGQQTSILFDTPFAVRGRWITVILLATYCVFLVLRPKTPLFVSGKWFLIIYLWLLWTGIVWLAQQEINVQDLIEDIGTLLMLMFIGFSMFGSYRKAGENPLKTLNHAFVFVNTLLVALSLTLLPFLRSSAFYMGSTRLLGIFTKPQFLSFAAANVLGFVIVKLVYSNLGRRWQIVLIALSMLLTVVVVVTQVRGTLVALVVALLITVFPRFSHKLRLAVAILLCLGVLAILLVPEKAPAVLRVGLNAQGEIDWNLTSSGRYRLAQRSLDELREYPSRLLFGTAHREDLYRYAGVYYPGSWHDPFALVHSKGLLGFLLYQVILLFPIYLLLSNRKRFTSVADLGLDSVDLYTVSFLFIRMFVSSLGDANLQTGHLDHIYYWLTSGLVVALFTMLMKRDAQRLQKRCALNNALRPIATPHASTERLSR